MISKRKYVWRHFSGSLGITSFETPDINRFILKAHMFITTQFRYPWAQVDRPSNNRHSLSNSDEGKTFACLNGCSSRSTKYSRSNIESCLLASSTAQTASWDFLVFFAATVAAERASSALNHVTAPLQQATPVFSTGQRTLTKPIMTIERPGRLALCWGRLGTSWTIVVWI